MDTDGVTGGDGLNTAIVDPTGPQAMLADCDEDGGPPAVGAAVVIEHEIPAEAMDTQEETEPIDPIPFDIHSDEDASMLALTQSPDSEDMHHIRALAPDDTMPVAVVLDTPTEQQRIQQEEQLAAIVAQQHLMQHNNQNIDTQHHPTMPPLSRAPVVTAAATSSDSVAHDTPMLDEEETRSEASFRFRVEHFSQLRESVLSPPTYVRNLPWKIMVMPRAGTTSDRSHAGDSARSLGFFLQCNGDSESTSWSCNAIAELRIHSFKPNIEPFVRKIKHLFYSKENDWGFSHFMTWSDIVDPDKGFVKDDTIELEVMVIAEAPHGVFWDSKKHTGYVGLKNQGATCYMNSLLQTLYFTNQLRKAVYKMPTEADDSSKSVGLALQRVFHDLQFLDKPVGTKKLTKSFGWEALDSFMQHDVQEFLRVLLDKLENKMKRTCVEGTVPRLFEGKMSSYIKCKNVNYKSTRLETFYDIQLNIKGKKNIAESFRDYIDSETLEGDNKYDAGEHGLQEAEKGVVFVAFPPVLHLHLMRFQYDPITDNSVKFNDRFEFYERINLDEYLQTPRKAGDGEGPADYTLHAVLVHSGDNHGGHYVVYINPLGDGRWCKFDDDVVSRCTKAEAIEHNYGGVDDDITLHAKHCSNAYMLVYIRNSEMGKVLGEIRETEIPTELIERLHEERRMEQVRRRERSEANTYMSINVLLEEYFEGHQTTDLFDVEKVQFRVFKLKKTQTVGEFLDILVEEFRTTRDRMRIWPLLQRHNQVTRLSVFDWVLEQSKPLINCADLQNPWTVYLEMVRPDIMDLSGTLPQHLVSLPHFDRNHQMFIFFKFYAPSQKRLNFCGCGYYALNSKFSDLVPDMCYRANFPPGTRLTIYEEQGTNIVQRIPNQADTLERVLKSLPQHVRDVDGVVLIFEKWVPPQRISPMFTGAQQQQPPISTMSPASPGSPSLPLATSTSDDAVVNPAALVISPAVIVSSTSGSAATGGLAGSGGASISSTLGGPALSALIGSLGGTPVVGGITGSFGVPAVGVIGSPPSAQHTVTSSPAAGGNPPVPMSTTPPQHSSPPHQMQPQQPQHQLDLPTCEDYFRDMLYRVEVLFLDKAVPADIGFTLELSQRMSYDQMATAVGQKINCDPYQIQFFKCQNYKDVPGHALRCSYDGNLKDLLVYNKPKSTKKIFYQRLSMNITELESKKQFKVLWHSINMKDEKEMILFPNKSGTVLTLLEEAAKQADYNTEEGSGQLRIVEVNNFKVLPGPMDDEPLEYLQSGETTIGNQKIYRIEEIPRDELNLLDDEMLIPVSHFFKDVYNLFGVPFYVRAKHGETYGELKERIRRKIALPDKEWEKFKVALITGGRYEYIEEDQHINLAEFRTNSAAPNAPARMTIGLEHLNKTQKRARFNYLEKAIKIYN